MKNNDDLLSKAAYILTPNIAHHHNEVQALLENERNDLRRLKVSEEKIEELERKYWNEAIAQPYLSNSQYVLKELRKYKIKL